MDIPKSKSIHQIQERMQGLSPSSLRYQVLESARDFKSSWIRLGQHLFSVYKDKLYRDWEYLTFEAYCAKEIGIRQNTAVKLLKSYSFLETEEPDFLEKKPIDDRKPREIPSVESVNALRLAKNNTQISEEEYEELRQDVLDEVKEEDEVKKKIRYILKTNPKDKAPEDLAIKKTQVLKKLSGSLQETRAQALSLGVSNKIVKKIEELLDLIADLGIQAHS